MRPGRDADARRARGRAARRHRLHHELVNYAPTNAAPRPLPLRDPGQVDVYSAAPPARAYVEIGVLSTYSASSLPGAVTLLRDEAAQRGCEGLVMGTPHEVTGGSGNDPTHWVEYTATCIAYR